MKLLETRMIWDFDEHNAFPDLVRFNDRWFCAVREGTCHAGKRDGLVRVISSDDGVIWQSVKLFALEGSDLRDPKLSVTPNGQLMLLMGELTHSVDKYNGLHVEVSFSDDGILWSEIEPASPDNLMWLWRVTWFENQGYGIAYDSTTPEWEVKLYKTNNGIDYSLISQLEVFGRPTESTIRFTESGTMLALVRREADGGNGWLGRSEAPYTDWDWVECDKRVSGQDLIFLPNGKLCVATRLYDNDNVRTSVCYLDPITGCISDEVTLPSAGDCSYPGMVVYNGQLWVSYYSSHKEKSSIYLSVLDL